jgi:2-C-methyl-D-erythritol 4-phosphate cytidylyltransferase/2-C-methyl-D-erythritol 2,4-cyclodiphosphate synthase
MSGNAALIVAAGRGERVGHACPKQYLPLAGKALLRHSVEAFLRHDEINHCRVVIDPAHRAFYDTALAGLTLPEPVHGGPNRQESVRLGLEALVELEPDCVLIHDAARPNLKASMITDLLAALEHAPGAIPGLSVADSLKRATDGMIEASLDRRNVYRAQTPQAFRFQPLLKAHRKKVGQNLGDDAAVAEAAGISVAIVPGDPRNLKITAAEDFALLESMMTPKPPMIRSGQGFDVHAFGGPGPLLLCGVSVQHDQGLAGHSDADVALHALTDALLGALAEGDIGTHFPPLDERWKDADSTHFLAHAAELLRQRGGQIANLDLTIICEAPKIGPYRQEMRKNLAKLLLLDLSAVSVKATTTEGLGFTGRGEGIAAQALVTVVLPRSSPEGPAGTS